MTEPPSHLDHDMGVMSWALYYASLGLRVVRIEPGKKKPLDTEWQHKATTDPAVIGDWWKGGAPYGVGIAAGPESGFFAIDIDPKAGGHELLYDWERMYGELPPGPRTITGGHEDGRHIYFAWDDRLANVRQGKLGDGVDIRIGGGQVLAEPSVHPESGMTYRWEDERTLHDFTVGGRVRFPECPEWMMDIIISKLGRTEVEEYEHVDQADLDASPYVRHRFNARYGSVDVARWLAGIGAHVGRQRSNGGIEITRPGKDPRHGFSAIVGGTTERLARHNVMYNWSTSWAEFPTEQPLDPFDVAAILYAGGDRDAFELSQLSNFEGARLWPGHPERRAELDAWALRKVAQTEAALAAEGRSESERLPDAFWRSRPELEHIRTAARARMVSPDGLLGAVLAKVSALTDYRIELPPTVARRGSLNVIVALVGASGMGKGSSMDVADELITATPSSPDHVYAIAPLGSGEGMVHAFFEEVNDIEDDGKGGQRTVKKWKQTKRAVAFRVDEGELVEKLGQRSGQTTLQVLRQAYSGETLGGSYASRDKKMTIPAFEYRASFVMAVQPALGRYILDDYVGGTPQRFVWLHMTDPDAVVDGPAWPGPLPWRPVRWDMSGRATVAGLTRCVLTLAPEIERQLKQDRAVVLRGEATDPESGHRNLNRLKVAALLGQLAGRFDVNDEDWRLAGIVLDVSDRVKQTMRDAISAEEGVKLEQRVSAQVRAEGKRREAADGIVSMARRLVPKLTRLVEGNGGQPVTIGALRRSMSKEQRRDEGAVLAHAEAQDWIRCVDDTEGLWTLGESSPGHSGSYR